MRNKNLIAGSSIFQKKSNYLDFILKKCSIHSSENSLSPVSGFHAVCMEAFLQIKFSAKHKIYEPELDYLSNTCDSMES